MHHKEITKVLFPATKMLGARNICSQSFGDGSVVNLEIQKRGKSSLVGLKLGGGGQGTRLDS